jgi:drug/metabolite transporter (DMT)-like permease
MSDPSREGGGVSPRFWLGLLLVVLVVIFIGLNREDATVSFLVFDAVTSLWVALAICAGLGFAGGWLIGRRRR